MQALWFGTRPDARSDTSSDTNALSRKVSKSFGPSVLGFLPKVLIGKTIPGGRLQARRGLVLIGMFFSETEEQIFNQWINSKILQKYVFW